MEAAGVTPKIMEQIQGVRERHKRAEGINDICSYCVLRMHWPCDAIQLAQKLELAVKALETLVSKLEMVHSDPGYMSMWTLAHVHGQTYNGPTYGAELVAAREALKAIAEVK